jgi:hypothetical protein
MTEILAGAIKTTSRGEVGATLPFGMSKRKLYLQLILPSAFRCALLTLGKEVVFMLHGTTVAFTATVPDVLKVARDANAPGKARSSVALASWKHPTKVRSDWASSIFASTLQEVHPNRRREEGSCRCCAREQGAPSDVFTRPKSERLK